MYIYIYVFLFVCFCYCLFTNSFAVVILAIKIKRYLHVSYMQFFNYLRIHSILRYAENQNLKP